MVRLLAYIPVSYTHLDVYKRQTECYLHRNTVSYHLKKIAEITGKTLNSTKDRSDWYMAYQIDEFLGLI